MGSTSHFALDETAHPSSLQVGDHLIIYNHPAYSAATKTRTPSRLALAEIRAARWERSSREAFLRGYFSEKAGKPDLLPRSQSNAGRLIALFETEKVFYELQYELDHRPDWVWVPLRGISKLYA